MENDYGFPIGTRVLIKSGLEWRGTVLGHKTNVFGMPLVQVHEDGMEPESKTVYYPSELKILWFENK